MSTPDIESIRPVLLHEDEWADWEMWEEFKGGWKSTGNDDWNESYNDECGDDEGEEIPIPLTQRVEVGGSASKWKPGEFDSIKQRLVPAFTQEKTKGMAEGEDCIVMHFNDEQAAVFAVDWFTPVVDDPYEFGAISAVSSLAPLYAAGVKPITALNIMALPCKMGVDTVGQVMRGGSDKVIEARAFVVGGHSVDDDTPKYGLAAFGIAPVDKILRNDAVVPGDVLFYTKRLGTGIMNEAYRTSIEFAHDMRQVVESMLELDKGAAEVMSAFDVHGAACIAAKGLVGHVHLLLETSGVSAVLHWDQLPLFDRVWQRCWERCRPARTKENVKWAKQFVDLGEFEVDESWASQFTLRKGQTASDADVDARMAILCDPQTSGGMVVAIPADQADAFAQAFEAALGRPPARIGEVVAGEPGAIRVV